ncbi:SIR2 family protein [Arthrobacter sp. NPDC056886]|uniref:SIR2 family protein n=1 Tax=Arthrobacter sp. NPDC056886 TaxID=3345960 RepID=UPI003671B288
MTARTIDPRIGLALSLQAQPGVYALLIGSGTSTGAGIPTGWGVIKDLVRQAAAAAGTPLSADAGDGEIGEWWLKHGDGNELGYSGLLESLGRTPAARSALLHGYFEPTDEDRADNRKVPGRAHHAIAGLVRRGAIRVILTTNFDSLIEQALDQASVPYQVLSTESAIKARKPLHHADCTVIKLHGDYRSLDQKNTLAELTDYGPATHEILHEVMENFGLIINGWSADWDKALVEALHGRHSRRYPLYWSTLYGLGPAAGALIEQHAAAVISNVTADDFFPNLQQRLDSLDALAAPQLSEDMAIARLKRLLPHKESYIEIRELLAAEISPVATYIRERGGMAPPGDFATVFDNECLTLRSSSQTLVRLIATGVALDRERIHADLWVWAVQQLLKARVPVSSYTDAWYNLAHYPALLTLRAIAMIAVTEDREDVFIRAATEPKWKDAYSQRDPEPAFIALQDEIVVDYSLARAAPRWNGTSWIYPQSELISDDMQELIGHLIGSGDDYKKAFGQAEYRMAMAHAFLTIERSTPSAGKYLRAARSRVSGDKNVWQRDFELHGDHQAWGWSPSSVGESDPFATKLDELGTVLARLERW